MKLIDLLMGNLLSHIPMRCENLPMHRRDISGPVKGKKNLSSILKIRRRAKFLEIFTIVGELVTGIDVFHCLVLILQNYKNYDVKVPTAVLDKLVYYCLFLHNQKQGLNQSKEAQDCCSSCRQILHSHHRANKINKPAGLNLHSLPIVRLHFRSNAWFVQTTHVLINGAIKGAGTESRG